MQTDLAPDSRAPPEGDEAEAILRKCVHCGFCTATCPTYQLLGDELDGPRGRIYLMKQVLEGAGADARDAAPPRPLPDLPQLRDHLPLGRAVRQPGRDRPRIVDARRAAAGRRAGAALDAEGRPDLAAVRAGDEGSARPCGRCCRRRCRPRCRRRAAGARAPLAAREHPRKVLLLLGCVQPAMVPNINARPRACSTPPASRRWSPTAPAAAARSACTSATTTARSSDMRRNIDAWWPLVASRRTRRGDRDERLGLRRHRQGLRPLARPRSGLRRQGRRASPS